MLRAGADDRRAAHDRALELRAGLDRDPALDPARVVGLAVHAALEVLEHEPVRLEHVGELAGVLPPAADRVALDPAAAVDQLLDRVGDLELAAPRGLDRPGGVEDRRGEHVDADERQVAGRVLRLLDQADDAVAVELGDAVVPRVGDLGEQDQRLGLVLAEGVGRGR